MAGGVLALLSFCSTSTRRRGIRTDKFQQPRDLLAAQRIRHLPVGQPKRRPARLSVPLPRLDLSNELEASRMTFIRCRARDQIRVGSLIVAFTGAVLLFGSVPTPWGWVDWPTSFVAPGAGLLGVGLTSLVAQLGLETVFDKRLSAIDASTRQNRSRVYEEIFRHVIQTFGGTQTLTDHEVRARAATWASSDTLRALSDWFRYVSRYTGTVAATDEALAQRYELVFRIANTMRNDLKLDTEPLDKATLLSALFETYDRELDSLYDTSAVRVSQTGEVMG